MGKIYKFSNEFHRVVKILFFNLFLFSISLSDIITKDNNNTPLDVGSSWVGGIAPGAGDIALWDNTVTSSNTVITGSDRYYLGIQIVDPAGDVTISNNNISLGTSGINMTNATVNISILSDLTLGSSQTWSIRSGRQIWHDGVISGGGNLNTLGDGTLFLNGNNTFTGVVTVNDGRLEISNSNSLGSTGSGTIVNNGGSLALNGSGGGISLAAEPIAISGVGDGVWGALVNDGGANLLPGNIVLNGNSVINAEDGRLTIDGIISGGYNLTKAGLDTLVLNSANTYSGDTYLINGVTIMTHESALGDTGSETVVDAGAELQIVGPLDSIFEPLSLSGSGINGNGALLTSGSGTIYHRGSINLVSATTIGNYNGYSFYLEGIISGNGDLTTKGGWIRIREANTYTGVTRIEPGLLQVLDDNALGNTDNGTVVNDGATLFLGGVTLPVGETITLNGSGYDWYGKLYTNYNNNSINGDIIVNSNSDINIEDTNNYITVNGIVNGSGNIAKNGDGVLVLTASNIYSGTTNINAGIVRIDNDTALGATTGGTVVASGAQLIINDINYRSPEPLILNGTGIDNKGALTAPCNSFTFYSGNITIASDAAIGTPSKPYSLILDGEISGSGNLSIVDKAYIQLEGDNSGFTGTLTIGGDMTRIGHSNALGATSAGTIVTSGSTLAFRDHTFAAEPITINGNGYNGLGAIYAKNESPELTGPVTLGSDSRIGVSEVSDIFTISGAISGGFELNKSGAGKLVLSGDNTFSNSIGIPEGAVYLNGSNSSLSSISVLTGATLGGTGSTSAIISLLDSASLDPGYGSAASFVTNSITMTSICSLNVDIGTNNDTVVVNGELNLDGVLNISNGEGFGPGIYTIMTYAGSLIDSGLTIGRNPGTYNYTVTTDADEVFLVVTSSGSGSAIVKANNTTDLNIGSSWVGGIVPGALDTAVWDNTIVADSTHVSLGVNTSWNQIKILDPGSTVHINDDTLTIGLGGVDMSNAERWLAFGSTVNIETNQEWNIKGPSRATCNGPLIGSYSITKTGTGYLRLGDDNNTFTGGLTISEGILQIGKNDAGGSLPVDVTNNGTVLFAKTVDYEYSGIISGTGSVEQGDTGTITLSGSNTYSGLTTVSAGALYVKHENALGNISSGTVIDSGAALIIGDTINILEPLTLNGNGTLNAGALINENGETQYDGPISISTASTISNISNNYFYLDGVISGNGNLTIAGSYPMVIREDNTYTGVTSVINKRLWLMEDNALGDITNSTVVFPDASVYLISGINVPESFVISGGGDDSAGVIKSYRDTNSISGNITLNGASIISVREDMLTLSGTVNGGNSLEKIGEGTLTLLGNNTNKGEVNITEGLVIFNGNNDSVVSVTVSNGAAIGGTGSIGGSVTLNDSSVLIPGENNIAKFSIGSLLMSNNCTLLVELGTVSDTVAVSSDLTLDGILKVNPDSGFGLGTYTILTYKGTLTDQSLTVVTEIDSPYNYKVIAENNEVKLIVSEADEDYSEWTYEKNIFINTTPSAGNILNNVVQFPLLVRLDSSNFNFDEALGNGYDVRFSKSDGTPLNYERERYDSINEVAEFWILCDTVYGNNNSQYVKMHWGKPDAFDQSNGDDVFSLGNGFVGVYHFGQDNPMANSISSSYSLTNFGTDSSAGQIGSGREFVHSDTNYLQAATTFGDLATLTVSAWCNATSGNGELFSIEDAVAIRIDDSNYSHETSLSWYKGSSQWGKLSTGESYAGSGWRYYSASIADNSYAKIYIDGSIIDSVSSVVIDYSLSTNYTNFGMRCPDSWNLNGFADEYRIENVTRSADWLKLCYENQRLDQTTVIVDVVNDTPLVISEISDITVDEDAPDTIIAILTSVFNDAKDSANLKFNAYSQDKDIVKTTITSDSILSFSFIENAHGTTNVVVTATDSDNFTGYDTVRVIINSINDAPVLHSITPWAMEDGLPVTLTLSQVYATDVDGDDLMIIIDTGANYVVDTLTITPVIGFTGFLNVPLSVTDGIDTSNKLTAIVEVKAAGENRPPILTIAEIPPIEKNGALRVTVDMLDAYDPDGDSLTIFIWEGDDYIPQGTLIIPDKGFTGYLQVPIKVTDGISLSGEVIAEISVFEKVIDFYKGQIINSDTYEASIGPNPLPPESDGMFFRSTYKQCNRMEIFIYDALANLVHKAEVENPKGRFNYFWELSSNDKLRSRAYMVILIYYKDDNVIMKKKKMIGIAK